MLPFTGFQEVDHSPRERAKLQRLLDAAKQSSPAVEAVRDSTSQRVSEAIDRIELSQFIDAFGAEIPRFRELALEHVNPVPFREALPFLKAHPRLQEEIAAKVLPETAPKKEQLRRVGRVTKAEDSSIGTEAKKILAAKRREAAIREKQASRSDA